MGLSDQEVTQQDLADVLGLSDRHLRNLKRTIQPTGKRGTALLYRLGPSVQAYCAHLEGATVARYTKKDLEEARIRQEIAKADKEEALARSALITAKRDEDAVVEVAQVQAEMESVFANVKARIRAVAPGLQPWLAALVGEDAALQVVQKLADANDEALQELYRESEDVDPEGGGKDEA